MSSSIAIPMRKTKPCGSSASSSFQYGSSASSAGSPSAPSAGTAALQSGSMKERRPLMSASLTKTEHTVVNIGDSESPRLITCVKTSQGFDWNQGIFLPSYADYRFDDLEHKQDPVEEIVVTDEEVQKMFPS